MLKRAPTRLELRGEGADQIEQEYQQAKAEREKQSKQQQQAKQTLQTPQATNAAASSAAVHSSPLNQSSSSFFSVDQ